VAEAALAAAEVLEPPSDDETGSVEAEETVAAAEVAEVDKAVEVEETGAVLGLETASVELAALLAAAW